MLMISFSKLIGVSLGLYISVASATPIATTQNTPVPLEPRKIAEPNGCGGVWQWVRRECVPSVSPQNWRDICEVGLPNQPPTQIMLYSTCPLWTVCENIVDEDQDRSIKCVDILDPGQNSTINTAADPQIQSSVLQRSSGSITITQIDVDIIVQNNVKASVSAVVMSQDKSFAVAPPNAVVGTLQRTGTIVCQGDARDDAQARECYPTGRYSLSQGDIINFTWGLVDAQVTFLASTIWPTP